jgi:dissimilatory sulfite reductase (desulfoviridin) alpha/beta subunit
VIKHKYRAKPTDVDGIKFHSKLEAAYYRRLLLRVKSGEVLFFLRQTPIHLPGNVKYIVDFLEFYADGSVHFIDVKGFETPEFKIKKKMVEDLYPFTVEIVKRV